jgi:hypothetical protein
VPLQMNWAQYKTILSEYPESGLIFHINQMGI